MPPMHSGRLRRRLQLQQLQPQACPNQYGEPTAAWVTVATVAAAVEPLAGRELFLAAQVRPDVTHRVTLRYYPGLAPRMRFLEAIYPEQGQEGVTGAPGRVLNIQSVQDLEERHIWTQCLCVEEV